jgi:hypothetical protein
MHKVPHILNLLCRRHAYTYVRKAASNGRIHSTNGAATPVDNQSKPKILANKTMCQNFSLSMLGRMGRSGVLAGFRIRRACCGRPQGAFSAATVCYNRCWHHCARLCRASCLLARWRASRCGSRLEALPSLQASPLNRRMAHALLTIFSPWRTVTLTSGRVPS